MGNWMTVNIVGSIAPDDLPAARAFVNTGEDWDRFHPLCNYGFSLCGLGDWVGEEINVRGNLSERNYDVEAVADTLRQMVAAVPSLRLKVHCGGDYESTDCIATVTVADGEVSIGPAEVATLDSLDDMATGRLLSFLAGSVPVEETTQ